MRGCVVSICAAVILNSCLKGRVVLCMHTAVSRDPQGAGGYLVGNDNLTSLTLIRSSTEVVVINSLLIVPGSDRLGSSGHCYKVKFLAMDSPPMHVGSSRLKSVVWNDFDRIRKDDTFVAVCRHCKKRLSGSSTSGTSHLRNHLIRCRRRTNHDISHLLVAKERKREGSLALANLNSDCQQKKDEMVTPLAVGPKLEQEHAKDGAISFFNGYFDQKRSRFDLARMIILHGYPLAMVEHVGFKFFVKNLQPLFELVTFDSVEADCMEIYEKEKQKVYEVLDKLPGKISLSADMWAATENANYLCLTAHFIDETWQLKKKILNFIMVDPSHTEDLHSEVIISSLMEWDIDRKLCSMTFDNCSNDNVVVRIRDRLSQNRFLLCNGQLFDVRCAVNILKLMAQDALEALNDVAFKIRESIKYVKGSKIIQEKFNEMAQHAKIDTQKLLCLDNPQHWSSTCSMLEVALEYRGSFSLLQEDDPLYTMSPSESEWERAGTITGYLKVFVEDTNVFLGSICRTANIYFPDICDIHLRLNEWCKDSDAFVKTLALKMKSKFDGYWNRCSLALAVAAILDPRFKMKLVEYYYPQIYGSNAQHHIDDVSDTLKALYNEHAIGSPLVSNDQGLAWQVGGSGGVSAGCLPGGGNENKDRLILSYMISKQAKKKLKTIAKLLQQSGCVSHPAPHPGIVHGMAESVRKIQGEIADFLGMKFSKETELGRAGTQSLQPHSKK
ncbi:hAT-like transposase, RNase-H fold [Dillenia turbinata]|uniref:HAT-like transposase, RNase-H fold n=1 Tax=Dillenia turbinata TaxID=194707 RepID=A0AAN8Z177_9MAGN